MSQENVEIFKRGVEAWNGDDFDVWIDQFDPEVEWFALMEVFRGHAGARHAWESFKGDMHLTVRFDDIRDLGESVLALGEMKGTGLTTRLNFTAELAQLLTYRGGKVVSSRDFRSHAEALEAVGLSEHNDRLTALPTVAADDKIRILNAGVEAMNAREVNEALLTDDFEIVNVSNAVTDKTYRGASGAREWLHDFFDVLDENARFEIMEIVEDGEDYLVVHNRLVGTGSASGVPFDMEWFSAWWFRDDRMARGVGYTSRRAALAAVHGDAPADS